MRPLLSLVVVCHEMARELPRTLLSLSPPYQRDVSPDEYEIIVVDNGSRDVPQAGQFGALKVSPTIMRCTRVSSAPVDALNEGLAAARGELIGAWIDGARLASPGLLRACLSASGHCARAVIATVNYQLGPQRQYLSVAKGYDQSREDELLRSIGWPEDGYRLFDIATPEIKNPPFGPMLESNALFMRRELWDRLGGYDPVFTAAGGGMVNPDTLARACALPDAQLIRIMGEGTFHQIHGGVTTSSVEQALRALDAGSRFYLQLRGRPLAPIRQVGWVFDAARNVMHKDDETPLDSPRAMVAQ